MPSGTLWRRSVLVLDGAMGTELHRRGIDTRLPLWSARAVRDNPDAISAIHTDYIRAGADIITTATFRTTRRTFRHAGIPDSSADLTARAVGLARNAADAIPGRHVLVAGSIAPLEDCYHPALVPPDAELDDEHGELAGRLAGSGVDILLIETMGTIREAVHACRAARATGLETIVSFLCTDGHTLYGGEPLDDAVRAVVPLAPAAISVNCLPVRHVAPALDTMRALSATPLGAYANAGREGEEAGDTMAIDVSPDDYARHAGTWKSHGARIIGGCCGTTPAYISLIAGQLRHD